MFDQINFLGSYPSFTKLPRLKLPEICFWGRSNVGKSSMINFISNRKDLAKVSSTPGKTVHFNIFEIDSQWIMVDLPGYGYASVSKSLKSGWEKEIHLYLEKRDNLFTLILLVDISLPPQKTDLAVYAYLGQQNVPFMIMFTKSDKCTKNELNLNLKNHEQALRDLFEPLPEYFITSVKKHLGRKNILNWLNHVLTLNKKV